jgi:hypothetical protein
MVIALAARLRRFFHEQEASALVGSAACGADLLALEIAGELSLRRRVILAHACLAPVAEILTLP